MGPKPSHGFPGLAPVAVALALIAACGDVRPPAPRDEASLAPHVASPETIVKEMLRPALQSQLRPGAVIVSHDFDMGD